MIIEYIRYQLVKHTPQQCLEAYRRATLSLQEAPECLGYEITQCVDDQASIILRIKWTSAADHMTKFRSGPHFASFLQEIRPFIGEIAEMRHYDVTDLAWQR
jgi:quinol monooxygenase YgiN